MAYQCKDRAPFAESVEMIDGWENAWLPHRIDVPFRMSPDCEYSKSDLGAADKQCEGCRWRANGQADTGAGVVDANVHMGDSVGALRGVESGSDGSQDPAGPGRASDAAEDRARLESTWPGSAAYQPIEEK